MLGHTAHATRGACAAAKSTCTHQWLCTHPPSFSFSGIERNLLIASSNSVLQVKDSTIALFLNIFCNIAHPWARTFVITLIWEHKWLASSSAPLRSACGLWSWKVAACRVGFDPQVDH